MRIQHAEKFKRYPNATVLATTSNGDGDEVWIKAIIKAKCEVERKFKKQARPWYAQVGQQGDTTICRTIECEHVRRSKTQQKSKRK